MTNGSELLSTYRCTASETAFADWIRRYSGLVYAAARRRLSNPTVAEDITQIVFARLASKPPALRTDGELAAWLHRTTVHAAIDGWRSEVRRQAREQEAALMQTGPAEEACL